MQSRALVSMLLACFGAASGCRREQHFSLLLEHSPTGWTAHCDDGCSWRDVTMQCTNCKVTADADGVHNGNEPMSSRGFAFVLDDSNGLTAHAVRGTRWANLSWNCSTAVCRCRINQKGVHVDA